MKLLKSKTNKLFYGKWPYKILCTVKGSWRIKRLGVLATIKYCLDDNVSKDTSWWSGRSEGPSDKTRLMSFTNDVEPFLTQDVQIRCEHSSFSIYCKDPDLYKKICKKLDHWISQVWESSETASAFYSTNTNKKILCNHLPYHRFKYKVTLRLTTQTQIKETFFSWIKKYSGKIKATEGGEKWASGNVQWWNNVYIYVEDAPTLTMVRLFLGNNLLKVQEYIPISSINTLVDQEKECPV